MKMNTLMFQLQIGEYLGVFISYKKTFSIINVEFAFSTMCNFDHQLNEL